MPPPPNQRQTAMPIPKSLTRNEARQARYREIAKAMQIQRVRVEPTSDKLRSFLRHPSGARFHATGSSDWPFDSFTHRRLRDGDIRVVSEEHPAHQAEAKPAHPPGGTPA